jgi:hypothetical protein
MKKLFLVVVLFCCGLLYGQNDQVKLPQVTPTSPEASSLGRYGDFDITNATGRMSYSVPIHTIKSGIYSWPIGLNYSYGGLILEGKPSLSGLGWNLSGYGSITKQTRGLPDGHPEGYYGENDIKKEINDLVSDYLDDGYLNSTSWPVQQQFLDGNWDSQVDNYTLNVAGETLSFKVKLLSNPKRAEIYSLSKTNYIIQANLDETKSLEVVSFIVTDDKGIQYDFNHREEVVHDPGAGITMYEVDNTTAWMLSSIKYPNSQTIDFHYEENPYSDYNFAASALEKDLDASNPGSTIFSDPVMDWAFLYNDYIRVSQLKRQVLKTITFSGGSLDVSTYTNSNKLLISKVEVKSYGKTASSFDFSYQGNRDVLTRILKNGENFYNFEYYGEHTPGTIPDYTLSQQAAAKPYDQDYWRFYNSAGNNRALHLPFDGPNFTANKQPNFTATRLGALKRIIYPTKGYTEVVYEQNDIKKDYEEGDEIDESFNNSFSVRVDAKTTNSDRYATITKTFTTPVRASLYHKIKGSVESGNSIYLSINKTSGTSDIIYSNCYYQTPLFINYYPLVISDARSKMIEPDASNPNPCNYYPIPIISPFLAIDFDPDNNCPWYPSNGDSFSEAMGCVSQTEVDASDDSRGAFWIVPGTYTFTVDVRNLAYGSLSGEIGLNWFEYENGTPQYTNKKVGGIRVKKLINFDNTGEITTAKHYDYKDKFGYTSGRLNQTPTVTNRHVWNHIGGGNTVQSIAVEFLLNSYTTLESNHGIPVYYGLISSHKNNSSSPHLKPNGSVDQEFYLPLEDLSETYPLIPRGEDITKALPSITRVRDGSGSIKAKASKGYTISNNTLQSGTDYDNSPSHPWSFIFYKKLTNTLDWDNNCYSYNASCHGALKSLHSLSLYKEVDSRRFISSKSTSQDGIGTSNSYFYNSKQLLNESRTTNSNGDIRKSNIYYANDVNDPRLILENRISEPIKTITYKGSTKLSTQNTIYTSSGALYMPERIQTAKSTLDLEDRIIYHEYDNKGNPVEVSKKDGTHIVYIWGYNQTQPIAKIENATYAEVLSAATSILNTDYNSLNEIKTISNLDTDAASELYLKTALDDLRNTSALSAAQVTTFTYDPLIGVTSVTDPRGQTIYYHYDTFNRLQFVKDHEDNILSKTEYKYKN